MRKAKITVAVITKNEERNIGPCLTCVTGWADEMLVIDGQSLDRTVTLAQGMGARVIDHPFENSFAVERNLAMRHASGDWVLHLDADDRVTGEFKKCVDDLIDRDPAVDIYKFKRKSFFLGHFMQYGGWYHYIPNLTRRSSVIFEGELHERPVSKGLTGTIDADIEHHPFGSIAQYMDRHNRYSSITAEEKFGKEGPAGARAVKKNAVGKSLKIFWKIYVKKRGYKEGMYGFIFAVLFAFTNFLVWVKYWELCQKGENR
ncbi:MAG: glycosyltransferase family 2 protein [Candidatus Omnitrophica bacterium]|nr:glycosyltransferase family 2 protein [Candidatus Omnitrophota bacterium]